jgi:hypothetical protein
MKEKSSTKVHLSELIDEAGLRGLELTLQTTLPLKNMIQLVPIGIAVEPL